MENCIIWFFKNINLVLFLLGLLVGIVAGIKGMLFERMFRWTILIGAGITSIYAGIGHIFLAKQVAANIGWATSPFQFEVGIANMAFGVLCILSFRASYQFRLASVIALTCWLWGAAIGHIREIVIVHNFAPGNAGSWLWTDLLVPLSLIILLFLSRKVD